MIDSSPQVVLFDWEGTLVDFQWNLQSAVHDAKVELRRLGFEPSTWEDNYATLRNRAVQSGRDKSAVIRSIDAVYDHYDADAASRWTLLPSVKTLLPFLRNEKQVQVGLVSNIGKKTLDGVLLRLGLADAFDVIVTRNDVEMLKPNGEGIRLALAKLSRQNATSLLVGDSVTDVLAAKEAGIKVAIVQGGESAPSSLIAAAPNYLWRSLDELRHCF